MASPTTQQHRSIRSFVVRAGRITAAQERALTELWPRYGVEFDGASPPDPALLFPRRACRIAEIGFGDGEYLASLAAARPDADFLGIEVHRPGVGHLLLAAHRLGLSNLRVVCHDALDVLESLPAASLDEVLLLFPDPWPKKRHHKRRLVQAPFVELIANRLAAGGTLRLATDWEPYAMDMLQLINACELLQNTATDAGFALHPDERAPTRFERRGARLGHGVWDLVFRRR